MKYVVEPIGKTPLFDLDKYDLTRFPGTHEFITARLNQKTNSWNIALTSEETEALSVERGEDVSNKSAFWEKFRVGLGDKKLLIDSDTLTGKLQLAVLKTAPEVTTPDKFRTKDYDPAVVRFLMTNTEEEEKDKVTRTQKKIKALQALGTLDLAYLKRVATVCLQGVKGVRTDFETMSPESIQNILGEFIEGGIRNIDKYNEILEMDLELLDAKYFAIVATQSGIIRLIGGQYKFSEEILGRSIEDVAKKLMTIQYASIYEKIREQVTDRVEH